ncbi:prephenate dehydratase [Oryzibacter oryziterrae]|uniref:prephenate dehydratase n=1 Tax=Oryzibacter oryziterrae TaxID=2766474 RepID=UPI001EFF84D5|nr:prephenate dehydratase [Oryzibacter oryziterrae]
MSQKLKVVFQGEPGANSHIAVQSVFPDAEPVPTATFEDCFAALEQGQADLAMIAIDNSLAGRVADVHHLLPRSKLYITGEFFLPIRFQLVAVPGARLEDIRTVESHVHALGQCRKIIRKHGLRAIVAADTAGAARQVAESGDKTRAALAPRLAAEIYGLDILAENVEDAAHNTTRFIVLSPTPAPVPALDVPTITSFIFRVRNMPAALYKALGGFATNGVNITKLESYQLEGQFFASQFYADVDGHPDDQNLRFALEELEFFSHEVRVLGSYPASPFRENIREPNAGLGLRRGE